MTLPPGDAPTSLKGKRCLVVGIANEPSIVAGFARAFVVAGAALACTYVNEKAHRFVQSATDKLGCTRRLPCDVRIPGQLDTVFEQVQAILSSG